MIATNFSFLASNIFSNFNTNNSNKLIKEEINNEKIVLKKVAAIYYYIFFVYKIFVTSNIFYYLN